MKNDHDLPPPGSELSRELTEEQQDLVEKEGPPIRDVMSRNVVTMDPGESLWEAVETFRRLHVHAAAVCTKGRFIGLVTERDIAVKGVVKPGSLRTIPIKEVMQTKFHPVQKMRSSLVRCG